MRFMILVRSVPAFEAETQPVPDLATHADMFAGMAAYHEELARAGVLLDAAGLKPTSAGWRIRYGAGDKRTVIDGPFAEAKELVAGYTLIQVRSREEALEWARRFPNPVGAGQPAEIEVRQLYEMDDFPPGATTERLKTIGTF
ncbi:YciI family protein [Pseudorhodoferax sp. Leaf274]|uniref:YciI family protein n=1 Tax=Pseudorhodoferax sp. Leaf274 TaxID=1736318 RepID=UPI0007036074|nr:YciI family protein [Pseudorhodoferax sp. Leaf274]KQP45095.1 dehydrogenase [Pseudorhodoferax sp. Leaf274]